MTDNICAAEAAMPFCTEDQRSNILDICVLPFDACGKLTYFYDTDLSRTVDSCQSDLPDPSTIFCEKISPYNGLNDTDNDQNYCEIFTGMTKCLAGTYERDVTYDLELTSEGICAINDLYGGNLCLYVQENKCILC